jgi:hypothetical protein
MNFFDVIKDGIRSSLPTHPGLKLQQILEPSAVPFAGNLQAFEVCLVTKKTKNVGHCCRGAAIRLRRRLSWSSAHMPRSGALRAWHWPLCARRQHRLRPSHAGSDSPGVVSVWGAYNEEDGA